jgi:prolipoprotein diacylglyceryl transferase
MTASVLPIVDWTVSPFAFHVPRTVFAASLALLAIALLVSSIVRRARDLLAFSGCFAVVAVAAAMLLPHDVGVRWYSLLFVLVFVGGHALLREQITRGGGPAADADAFVVYGVLGVLVGTRLSHVLFYDLRDTLEHPLSILDVRGGGLSSHGAVIGCGVAMLIFTRRRGVPFIEGCDRFAFSAALGATLVRVGNLMNSEVLGKPTDGTWGFRFLRADGPDAPLRHPSQLYEVALGLAVLALLLAIDKLLGRERRPRGVLIASFFVLYFTGRFAVEYFKEPTGSLSSGHLTTGQVLSLPGLVVGWICLAWALQARHPTGWTNPAQV